MIDITLFGPTAIVVDRAALRQQQIGGVKPRQVLEVLAVNLGSPVSKDRLADQLWEQSPPASYVATLESYVCVLRRHLGRGKESPLVTTRNGYLLDPDRVRVDLVECRRLLAAATNGSPALAVSRAEQAVSLMRGELLADQPYAGWAVRERERLAEQAVVGLTRAAELARLGADNEAAIRFARRATGQGVLTESAWQELMRALWSDGRRAEALRAYADLRATMLDELGIEPSPVTQRLYLEILNGTSSGRSRAQDRHEVRTLLRLLRQALEAGTGLDVASEPGLSEVARVLLRNPA